MFCNSCGAEVKDAAVVCVKCGCAIRQKADTNSKAKSKTAYIVLGIIPITALLGIANFYSGHTGRGVAKLLCTIFLGLTVVVPTGIWIWSIIEVLTNKKDAEGQDFA